MAPHGKRNTVVAVGDFADSCKDDAGLNGNRDCPIEWLPNAEDEAYLSAAMRWLTKKP